MRNDTSKEKVHYLETLRPVKYEQLDFFIADTYSPSSIRDDLFSMEHPFFSLQAKDLRIRKYNYNNSTITVSPHAEHGVATIFDKDMWLYAISKLQQAMYENKPVSRTIRFTAYDYFMMTNRGDGGNNYKKLKQSLDRLSGTRITTNIRHDDNTQEAIGFGLVDSWRIVEGHSNDAPEQIEITLPNWLYQSITENKVLKISPDYFRIRKAIDRRIYELARKHCGFQEKCEISLEKLAQKTGSTRDLRRFRYDIKKLSVLDDLPDYSVIFDTERDIVTFVNKNFAKALSGGV